MWIEKTKNGLRLVERYTINGKTRRVSVPVDRDTAQARKRAETILREKVELLSRPISAFLLSEVMNEYVTTKECRESTRKYITAEMESIKTILEDMPIGSITPGTVKHAFAVWSKPPQVVNRAIIAFKTFSKWAYEMEYTMEDIGARITKRKIMEKEKDPSEMYLEPDQLRELLSNLYGMPHYMTRFLALTGCRIGEACALTPEDIGDKYIKIDKSYSDHSHDITPPKNRSSIRDIYIQPELAEMLTEYRQWRALDIMARGIRPTTLFYSQTGTIYQERYYRNVLYKHGTHPHALRHTHVALLAEQGMTLEAIARRIGHAGTGTTEKVYYHVTRKQREKDEKALAAVRIL